MPTIDSDGCRPPITEHVDHPFRRMASTFLKVPASVVALVRDQWTAWPEHVDDFTGLRI
jgi:hypothetical protein